MNIDKFNDELTRLERATAPRSTVGAGDLDDETRGLRETWLELSELLAACDGVESGALCTAGPVTQAKRRSHIDRHWIKGDWIKGRWSAPAACGAALSVALLATIFVVRLPGISPLRANAARSPASTGAEAMAFRAPSPWVDQLDEQIAATGMFVNWLENDPAKGNAADDRALDALLSSLDAMKQEAASGSL